MFLYSKGSSSSFSVVAEQHYTGLEDIRTLKAGKTTYYANSLVKKVEFQSKAKSMSSEFFVDLIDRDQYLLKKLIVGKPDDLIWIIENIEANILIGRYPAITRGKKLTSFGKKIKKVFNYTAFTKKSNRWDAYSLAEALSVDVCAYCNRNFTFTLTSGKKKIVRPEFDHFLPKAKYPYLALSFYNLIPSCHICNSNLKHTTDFNMDEYLHPYLDCFDDIVEFSVELKGKPTSNLSTQKASFGVSFFYGDMTSFDIVFKEKNNVVKRDIDRALKNIEVFKLKELYNRHKDLVTEMVQNTIIYDDTYIDSLFKRFDGSLFRSKEDVLRHITKNYINDSEITKRAFSKLSRDIHKEFGLRY